MNHKFFTLPLLMLTSAANADALNVLIYHHVDDSTPHSTSTRVDDFIKQLDAFEQQGYEIVDLQTAVREVQSGQETQQKRLALTFDDGFRSVCDTAYPILKERNLPFTVFVTTDPVDANYQGYCDWEQLREMSKNGATIANHTLDHAFLVRESLQDTDWFQSATRNIEQAQLRIEQEIGHAPMLFAYPYGEYNHELRDWLKAHGYIAFGQQSGSIEQHSDWQALPRFNAAGNYASVSSLRFKTSARALPTDFSALPDPVVTDALPPLTVELTPSDEAHYPHLQCYFNGQSVELDWHDDTRFTVLPPKELVNGRHRINCTAPHRNGSPFYWLSQQWLVVNP
ncbi:polysaccharide deacetylase family protein [Vibrio agarivorans]|uniref:polysaccharide deacetylase family protein n=1 Tax=Vibrio agarivorans TaxID=153622 RepID=UPI00223096E5|nr:polysaccharide deacetylase family protein [Vibrio agarivorans]